MDVVIWENVFYGIYCKEPQHCELAFHILNPHMSERDSVRGFDIIRDSLDDKEPIYTIDFQLDKVMSIAKITDLLSPFFDNVVFVDRYRDIEEFFT